jgi:hypothetical protein
MSRVIVPTARRSTVPLRAFVLTAVLTAAILAAVAPSVGRAQSASLRALADDAGVSLGAAADADAIGDDEYRQLLIEHVNLVSTRGTCRWPWCSPSRGSSTSIEQIPSSTSRSRTTSPYAFTS